MPNPIDSIDMSFLKWPHVELANRMMTIADAFAVHPGFQETCPPTVPNAQELKEIGTHYNVLATAALSGDRGKMAERDLYRQKAVQVLGLSLTWAAMRASREDNPGLIANLGVDQKKKAQSRSTTHALPGVPKDVHVKHGPNSGTMILNLPKVTGAVIYIVQACQGDPSKEESWSLEWQFASCKGMQVTGLEPGKLYFFRVRCFGHVGHGPWSSLLSLMAI